MKDNLHLGITGQHGFIGTHLYNYLKINTDINLIPFNRDYFIDEQKLSRFVKDCDVIIHLAGKNREKDERELYNSNIQLVNKLIKSIDNNNVHPVLFLHLQLKNQIKVHMEDQN